MASLFRILTSEPLVQKFNQIRFVSTASSLLLTPDSQTSLATNHHKNTRHVLSLLRTENNPDRILEIFRSASLTPHHHLHRVAFSLAVATLSNHKHFSAVSRLLDGFINKSQQQPESFAVRVIILYGRANMLDRSLQTFHNLEMYEIQRTVKSLNALLLACLIARDYEEAKRVYSETPKKYGIEPDLETYNRIIKAMCESNSTSSSYSVIAEMERRRVRPRASTFGLMIGGFYKEEKYDEVRRVLGMMREFGVHVGIATYNVMVKCLCERKRSREAKALVCGVVSSSSRMRANSVTYCLLIRGFCSEGELEEAMGVFEVMVRSGCKGDSECYFGLIRCLCERGEFETALVVCRESMEKDWVPSFSVMRWLVHGLVGSNKVDEAREVISEVKGKFSRNVDLWDEVEAELPR